jgi:hypothetical protein
MLHRFREDFLWQGDNYIEIHRTVTNFDTCALFWELINTALSHSFGMAVLAWAWGGTLRKVVGGLLSYNTVEPS